MDSRRDCQNLCQFLKSAAPSQFLVDKFLPVGSYAQLFGPPGAGKSFVAIDIALSVATGKPWHGLAVQEGPVFYIAAERESTLPNRFKAWLAHYEVPPELPKLAVFGGGMRLNCERTNERLWFGISDKAKAWRASPKLIVLDPISRFLGDEDEDRPEVVNRLAEFFDQYRKEWGATVLQIHHSGHKANGRARGSSALRANLDAEYQVSQRRSSVVVKNTKMSDAEPPDPLELAMTPIYDSLVLTTADVPSRKSAVLAGLGTNQREGLKVLKRLSEQLGGAHGVPIAQWLEACRTNGIDRRRLSELQGPLESRGYIITDGQSVSLTGSD